jgi:hypothetical protein
MLATYGCGPVPDFDRLPRRAAFCAAKRTVPESPSTRWGKTPGLDDALTGPLARLGGDASDDRWQRWSSPCHAMLFDHRCVRRSLGTRRKTAILREAAVLVEGAFDGMEPDRRTTVPRLGVPWTAANELDPVLANPKAGSLWAPEFYGLLCGGRGWFERHRAWPLGSGLSFTAVVTG